MLVPYRILACFLLLFTIVPSWAEEIASEVSAKQDEEAADVDELYRQGSAAYDAKDYALAIKLAEKIIQQAPEDYRGYWLRGQARILASSELNRALADFEQVNRIAPDLARPWGIRCGILILLGRASEAQVSCKEASVLEPTIYNWFFALGHTYLLQGNLEKAKELYTLALPLVAGKEVLNKGILATLDQFIEHGWEVDVVKEAREWLVQLWMDWEYLQALQNQINELYEKGLYQDAIPLAEESVQRTTLILGDHHDVVASRINYLALLQKLVYRYSEAEDNFRKAVSIGIENHGENNPLVAVYNNNLAGLLQATGRYNEAESLFRQALSIFRQHLPANDPRIAKSLNTLAGLLADVGRYNEAEPLYRDALAAFRNASNPVNSDIATCLNDLGELLNSTGQYVEAEKLIRDSLAMRKKIFQERHPSIADSLNDLAMVLENAGRYKEAARLYLEALAMRRNTLPEAHPGIVKSLNNLAHLFTTTGRYSEAEAYYRKALAIFRDALPELHPDIATCINHLAALLDDTGRYDEAEELYREALAIRRKALPAGSQGIVISINNLGGLLQKSGRYDDAEPLLREALALNRQTLPEGHPNIATSLNNLAVLLQTTGRKKEAELLYSEALSIRRKALPAEHPDLAASLNNLAWFYQATGRYKEAEPLFYDALQIADQGDMPEVLWSVYSNLGYLYAEQNRPELAIYFCKQAVNTLQSVRKNLSSAERDVQQTFVKSKEGYYKHLADLLVGEGRLPEAEQVLAMLKEQEYYDYLRGDTTRGDVRQTRVDCNAAEAAWCERYGQISDRLAGLGAEYATLKEKEKGGLSAEEQASLTQLEADLKVARQAFNSFLDELKQGLVKAERALPPEVGKRHRQLQAALRTLGHGAVALHYFVTDERLNIILTTPETQLARQVPWDTTALKDTLNQSVLDLRARLTHPGEDPRPLAKELYDTLIGPVAADLEQVQAQTLMVSLDGTLRYLPLAALYDGEHYLAERYALVIYTEAANLSLTSDPQPWRVAGLGVSRSKYGDLMTVPQELEAIVRHGDKDTDGVLPGAIELDGAFTEAALREVLQSGTGYPVLHVASHFVFKPGNVANSYLVLGNDEPLTLAQIRDEDLDLGGVELLTLSACETAMGGSGSEVEGFGALAQDQGAQGVMATLWKVADASTGTFMAEFYRKRETEHLTKAEALRQVQLAFIRGEIGPQGKTAGTRGEVGCLKCDKESANAPFSVVADYSHPYYWAPFILMGNWL